MGRRRTIRSQPRSRPPRRSSAGRGSGTGDAGVAVPVRTIGWSGFAVFTYEAEYAAAPALDVNKKVNPDKDDPGGTSVPNGGGPTCNENASTEVPPWIESHPIGVSTKVGLESKVNTISKRSVPGSELTLNGFVTV